MPRRCCGELSLGQSRDPQQLGLHSGVFCKVKVRLPKLEMAKGDGIPARFWLKIRPAVHRQMPHLGETSLEDVQLSQSSSHLIQFAWKTFKGYPQQNFIGLRLDMAELEEGPRSFHSLHAEAAQPPSRHDLRLDTYSASYRA